MANEMEQAATRYGLVLSGGGMRIATHAGLVAEMADWTLDGKSWLDQVQVLVGTSAGALYAALLAAGYTPGHIAAFAVLFAQPGLKEALFNFNYDKAAAAFLQHDLSYVRGIMSGFGVLTLMETTLSKSLRNYILTEYPDPSVIGADEKLRRRAAQAIAEQWKKRREGPRDDTYYQDPDLLTFADCAKELYLISVNAYTGQKTVFCRVGTPEEAAAQDQRMAAASPFIYINRDQADAALQKLSDKLNLARPLNFKRYTNRVYRDFDTRLYGQPGQAVPQLPLALAVRSSLSVPVVFEPSKIRRAPAPLKTGAPIHAQPYDLFLDGAVDDNFALSVAADPELGGCTDILGIFLGNLGYRLPDVNAVSNVATILLSTTGYMGDALQEWQALDQGLTDHRITIINALPQIDADITDTDKIPGLIDEARGMARQFWTRVHGAADYPATRPVPLDKDMVFMPAAGQRVYLSQGALTGPASFPDFIQGQAEPASPVAADVLGQIPALISRAAANPLARGWLTLYGVLLLLAYGLVTLVSDLIGEPTGLSSALRRALGGGEGASVGWLVLRLFLALVIVLLVRLWAYGVWARMHRKAA
ncbi:MAG: patatin-like phospholipase family protein [Anaerolineae bacterium]